MMLEEYLKQHNRICEETTVWANGRLPLVVRSYLSPSPPPQHLVTSARAIVFNRNGWVLAIRDGDATHVVPGGRLDAGEGTEAAMRREVLEETGWTLAKVRMLGVKHFHHLSSKPHGYAYPHPDFLQVVFVAMADKWQPEAMQHDENVQSSAFCAIEAVEKSLSQSDLLYLRYAMTVGQEVSLSQRNI
jgi:ADP-ribose pyrophosphatase YjhB (NUDIX family)